jgi:hypothetical protein
LKNNLSRCLRRKLPVALSFFVFYAALPPAVYAETVIEQRGAGRGLRITTEPEGAKVYVDGIERGQTPLVLEDIIAGTHTIRLTRDYYEDWERSVSFSAGALLSVSVDLVPAKGRLDLTLTDSASGLPVEAPKDRAAGFELYVDGNLYDNYSRSEGAAPLILLLPEGRRTILVRLFGYNEAKTTVLVERGRPLDIQLMLEPAKLQISKLKSNRKSFNPANSGALGSIILYFSVTRAGFGRLTVTDEGGETIFRENFGEGGSENAEIPFKSRNQAVIWDGKDSNGMNSGAGVRTLNVEVRETAFDDESPYSPDVVSAVSASLPVTLDPSAETYPLSIAGGMAGLINAVHSRTLPSGSFQMEAALLAGAFGGGEEAFSSLPFALGFRFAPLSNFEIGGAVTITPQFGGKVYVGAALSAKKELWRAKKFIPGIALGISGGWINGKAETEQGLLAGAGLTGAFSWDLPSAFSLLFSPGLIWTGEGGYPGEAAPRAVLGGGLLWRRSFAVAGISLRSLYAFAGGERGFSPLKISAELRLYPPPSNFIAGAALNCVITDGGPYFSAALTIGFIF